jgi:hypothetical protein
MSILLFLYLKLLFLQVIGINGDTIDMLTDDNDEKQLPLPPNDSVENPKLPEEIKELYRKNEAAGSPQELQVEVYKCYGKEQIMSAKLVDVKA